MIELGVVKFNENMEEDDQLHQEEEAAEAIRQRQAELLEHEQQLQEAIRHRQEEEAIMQHQAELLEQEQQLQEAIRQCQEEEAIRQHQAKLIEQEQQLQEAIRQHQEEDVIRQHQEELLEQAAQEEAIRRCQEEDATNPKPYHPPIRFSPKATDHFRVSERKREDIFDIAAENRKKARAGTRRSKRLHDFALPQQHAGNEVQRAPSADAHRHEMALLDALEANFRADFQDINEDFPDDRT
jgi:hypothetical protein